MLYAVCVLSGEDAFARAICLELADRGLTAVQVRTPEAAAATDATAYLIDADAFSYAPVRGRAVYYGRAPIGDPSLPYLHRPFSLASLPDRLRFEGHRGLSLLPAERAALLDGERIPLSGREYDCLSLLLAAHGAPVPQEELLRAFGAGTDGGILPVYIHYLRKKLERGGKKMIYAIRGRGYALRQEETP